MFSDRPLRDHLSDRRAAELSEVATELILRAGVRASSIEVELDVWHSLRGALCREGRAPHKPGTGPNRPEGEALPAALTAAAYGVALRKGLKGSFLDLEVGLWNAFRQASGPDRVAVSLTHLGARNGLP